MTGEEKGWALEAAMAFGTAIREQYRRTHGEVTAAAEELIEMLCQLDVLHREAVKDLEAMGLREPYNVTKYNKGTRENKALGPLLKIQTQKARLLRELRLLPGSRKGADREDEDVEDDELDHY